MNKKPIGSHADIDRQKQMCILLIDLLTLAWDHLCFNPKCNFLFVISQPHVLILIGPWSSCSNHLLFLRMFPFPFPVVFTVLMDGKWIHPFKARRSWALWVSLLLSYTGLLCQTFHMSFLLILKCCRVYSINAIKNIIIIILFSWSDGLVRLRLKVNRTVLVKHTFHREHFVYQSRKSTGEMNNTNNSHIQFRLASSSAQVLWMVTFVA